MADLNSLKVKQQDDGQYLLEWDKEDPQWKFLNDLTPEQIKCIVQEAIRQDKRGQLSLQRVQSQASERSSR